MFWLKTEFFIVVNVVISLFVVPVQMTPLSELAKLVISHCMNKQLSMIHSVIPFPYNTAPPFPDLHSVKSELAIDIVKDPEFPVLELITPPVFAVVLTAVKWHDSMIKFALADNETKPPSFDVTMFENVHEVIVSDMATDIGLASPVKPD